MLGTSAKSFTEAVMSCEVADCSESILDAAGCAVGLTVDGANS